MTIRKDLQNAAQESWKPDPQRKRLVRYAAEAIEFTAYVSCGVITRGMFEYGLDVNGISPEVDLVVGGLAALVPFRRGLTAAKERSVKAGLGYFTGALPYELVRYHR